MNPIYMPVIGSGFDADAAQQANWAQFNRGVEEANLGRLAAAQQTRNNWLQQVQSIQQQQADRQAALDQRQQENEMSMAMNADRARESRRQFDVSTGLTREQMKANLDLRKAELDLAHQTADNAAQALAPDVHETSSAFEEAQKALADATKRVDTQAATVQAAAPSGKVIYNTRAKMFVPADLWKNDPEAQQAANNANIQVGNAKAEYDSALQEYKFQNGRLTALATQAKPHGLIIAKKDDRWVITDPATGKVYKSESRPPAKVTTTNDEVNPPSLWFGGTRENPWPGATQSATPSADSETLPIFAPTGTVDQSPVGPETKTHTIGRYKLFVQ